MIEWKQGIDTLIEKMPGSGNHPAWWSFRRIWPRIAL